MPFPPLPQPLARALADRGYLEPTPVQAAVLEPEHAGKDLLVSAQTGSGKTVAYGLALAPHVTGPRGPEPAALVVAPTRELALQVAVELRWLLEHARVRVASCVGGMDMRREERNLFQGADVVVGTPGRLCDHLRRGTLKLGSLKAVVLDEADEMLDLGFREEMELLLDAAPAQRQTLLFSATIPKPIATLAARYQKDAVRIASSAEDEPHGDIDYRAFLLVPGDREHAVVNALRWFDVRGALVFCSTRESTKRLHGNLLERGFSVVALSGELSQAERSRAMQSLRDGRARACIATDVAARGLDLPDLGLVIHFDLPRDKGTLLHRSGRTGRAGRKGTCVLLVPLNVRRTAERLIEWAGVRATWTPAPSADDVRARDQDTLVREISELSAEPSADDLAAARRLLAAHEPELLAAALVRMHRRALPAPEELAPLRERPRDDRRPDGPRGDDRAAAARPRGPWRGKPKHGGPPRFAKGPRRPRP